MSEYLMQAVSDDDGELYTWLAASADFAATGFPGPGSAEHVAVARRPLTGTAALPSIAPITALANITESAGLPVAVAIRDFGGVVNAKHYGLDPSNSASENDAALAAALAAANGTPLYAPFGTYDVSATWTWENLRGQVFFGDGGGEGGPRRTRFRWVGESGTNFIRLFGSRDCHLRDFEVTFLDSGTVYCDDVILSETRSGSPVTNNWFTNIFITGPVTKRYDRGIAWIEGTGGNANNDLSVVTKVLCTNYAVAGFDITHNQSTGHVFKVCAAGGGPIGLRTVSAFEWNSGTSFSGNSDADFYIAGAATTQQSFIRGYRSEGSARLLFASLGSSTMSLAVEDCSVHSGNLHADGRIISWTARSLLAVRNCRLGSSTADAVQVYLHSTGNRNAEMNIFDNVRILSSLAPDAVFANRKPKVYRNVFVENVGVVHNLGVGGAMGPHELLWATGQRTRTSSTPANHIRDYPDATATTDATATVVLAIGVPTNRAGRASFAVTGCKSTGEIWSAVLDAHVVNSAGTLTIRDQDSSPRDPDTLGYSAAIVVDGTELQVQVTGGATDEVKWACVPELLLGAL